MEERSGASEGLKSVACLECGGAVDPDTGVDTPDGAFCRECYDGLVSQVEGIIKESGQNINYASGIAGALAGGAVGVLVWWGFTYLTQYAFGLIAIVIGIAVAKGMLFATGGKRSQGLQAVAIGVTVLSYFYADYLVSRSFLLKENPSLSTVLSLIPSPSVLFDLCSATLDVMGLVFLGIAVWQAWSMTRPFGLKG